MVVWGQKKKKKEHKDHKGCHNFIERDTLIKLSVKKETNECFVDFEQKHVLFDPRSMTWKTDSKKYKLLARMMK